MLNDLTDEFVEVLHHGDEVGFSGGFVLGLFVGDVSAGAFTDGIRSRDKGVVNEDGGIVEKEGMVLVPLHEVTEEVGHEVGAVFKMVVFLGEELAVLFEGWRPEALAAFFAVLSGGDLPEAVFVEAGFDRAGGVLVSRGAVVEAVELPLSGDGVFIAGGFEKVGEGFFVRV